MSEESELLFGFHAVCALLQHQPRRVTELLLLAGRDDQRTHDALDLASQHRIPVQRLERSEMDRLLSGNHQGFGLRCKPASPRGEQELPEFLDKLDEPPLLLMLDSVSDPHNLGACMRSAEAAGAHAVIVPKDKAATLGPTVRKVACGAAELLPIFRVTNLARCMGDLKQRGIWLTGLCGETDTSLFDVDLKAPTALLMGAEGKGLRTLTRRECDHLAAIPMPGSMESLNVSVAAGICLFEAVRQRL